MQNAKHVSVCRDGSVPTYEIGVFPQQGMCLVESSNQMPLFVWLQKCVSPKPTGKGCCWETGERQLVERPARDTVCTESFPPHGLHRAASSPRSAKQKWRYWSSMWQIVQFNFFIHNLCCTRRNVWLVRKGWGRAEGGKLPGHSWLLLKRALQVASNRTEEKVGDWFLPQVQMRLYSCSKPQSAAQYKTQWEKHCPEVKQRLREPQTQTQRWSSESVRGENCFWWTWRWLNCWVEGQSLEKDLPLQGHSSEKIVHKNLFSV